MSLWPIIGLHISARPVFKATSASNQCYTGVNPLAAYTYGGGVGGVGVGQRASAATMLNSVTGVSSGMGGTMAGAGGYGAAGVIRTANAVQQQQQNVLMQQRNSGLVASQGQTVYSSPRYVRCSTKMHLVRILVAKKIR